MDTLASVHRLASKQRERTLAANNRIILAQSGSLSWKECQPSAAAVNGHKLYAHARRHEGTPCSLDTGQAALWGPCEARGASSLASITVLILDAECGAAPHPGHPCGAPLRFQDAARAPTMCTVWTVLQLEHVVLVCTQPRGGIVRGSVYNGCVCGEGEGREGAGRGWGGSSQSGTRCTLGKTFASTRQQLGSGVMTRLFRQKIVWRKSFGSITERVTFPVCLF